MKKGREWSIRLIQKGPILPTAASEEKPSAAPLVSELTQRGMTATTASELVDTCPAVQIERQIEFFDWRMEREPEKIGQPGGYLVDAIKKDYAAPKKYVSRTERRRQEEARRAKEREAAEQRRREQVEEARQLAEKKAIAAYWDSLTRDQRAAHDVAAIAQASAEEREADRAGAHAEDRHGCRAGRLHPKAAGGQG